MTSNARYRSAEANPEIEPAKASDEANGVLMYQLVMFAGRARHHGNGDRH